MRRRHFLQTLSVGAGAAALPAAMPAFAAAASTAVAANQPANDREYWWRMLDRIASPVVENLARGQLVRNMPVEKGANYGPEPAATYVEAVGRCYAGLAPWLALPDDAGEEGKRRRALREQALQGLANAVDPKSPDKLDFGAKWQPIVDAAYLAHALLRAPDALWKPLDARTKQRLVAAFQSLRDRKPWYNNWLLFAAMSETFLRSVDAAWDPMRVDYAINKLEEWYVGDGWYSDGPNFAYDYYNGFVMHPMMVDVLRVHSQRDKAFTEKYQRALKRMRRFGEQQERMISPEGTFPPIGRSITYRASGFQPLAQLALMEQLPEKVTPGQVRAALTAVTRNVYDHPGTFDANGWLTLGFVGHQPEIADYYTSTGSLYMATLSFLPLGLPADNAFWTAPAEDWTAKRAWSGRSFPKDYHVDY